MPKVSLNPMITESIVKMKNDIVFSACLGKYKDYKNARKAYATFAIDNFELCKNTNASNVNAPLFSKVGLNMLKVVFLDLFRPKTKDEKKLKQMAFEEKIKHQIQNSMNKRV